MTTNDGQSLGSMVRDLLTSVAGDASASVSIEKEEIGHAVKTTISVWQLTKPAKQPRCERLVPSLSGSDRLCGLLLTPEGECPAHPSPKFCRAMTDSRMGPVPCGRMLVDGQCPVKWRHTR